MKGKCVLVTGATSGIGNSIARRLLEREASVVAIGRNAGKLKELEKLGGGGCTTVAFDLSDLDELGSLATQLPAVDGVVCSAGIVRNNPIKFFNRATFEEVIGINLLSPLFLTVALSNAGKLNRGGSVVFLSSTNGTSVGIKGTLAYATSKAGLTGAAKVLALEMSGKGVRVNSIAPGMVATEMVSNLSQLSEDMVKADMAKYPLGKRYATPTEVADLAVFLLSDASTFITGQTVTIDGGYCIQ